jgi:hypothetical protein
MEENEGRKVGGLYLVGDKDKDNVIGLSLTPIASFPRKNH